MSGTGNILNDAVALFNRINTVKAKNNEVESLDSNEIAQARSFGFSLFKLDNNMKQEVFVREYTKQKLDSSIQQEEFEKKERDIHVKYLQLQYDSPLEPEEGELLEAYEYRLQEDANRRNAGMNSNPTLDEKTAKKYPNATKQALEVSKKKSNKTDNSSDTSSEVHAPRMSYREAYSLLMQSGQAEINRMKDGGSTSCTVSTKYGAITIFLDNKLGSGNNGCITVSYPDGTFETVNPNGELVTPQKENSKPNHKQKFDLLK